jgi:uncharacterized membrane protein
MPDDIAGVPTHPLIVHIPVVMVPLALIAVIAYLAIKPWRRPLAWVAGALSAGGAVGAVLAASSGESLRERVRVTEAVEEHAEMGETARLLAFIFFVVVAALVIYQEVRSRHVEPVDAAVQPPGESHRERRVVSLVRHRLVAPVLAALLIVTGGAAVWSLVAAGHAGAKITWEKIDQP